MDIIHLKPIISIRYAEDTKAYQKMGLLTYENSDSILCKPRPIGYFLCNENGHIINIRYLTEEFLLNKLNSFNSKSNDDKNLIFDTTYQDWIEIIEDELAYRKSKKQDINL